MRDSRESDDLPDTKVAVALLRREIEILRRDRLAKDDHNDQRLKKIEDNYQRLGDEVRLLTNQAQQLKWVITGAVLWEVAKGSGLATFIKSLLGVVV